MSDDPTDGPELPEQSSGKPKKPATETVYIIDGFMVMFTALSMILLAFFIMLNALAVPSDSAQRNAMGSLLGSFGILPEGVGVDETGSYVASAEFISLREESVLFAAFEAYVEEEEWQPEDVKIYIDAEGRRRIRLSDSVLYGSGSSRFHPRVMPLLDRVAAMLRTLKRPIEVEGHTDGAQGKMSNWKLSARRASSIVRYLEAAGKLPGPMLSAVGYGDTRPLPSDEGVGPQNRRVEVVVQ
ncbi:MAG: chemotaxis protein MotB [Myxococcota bacterium]|jgi:chemotaxis protein MotB